MNISMSQYGTGTGAGEAIDLPNTPQSAPSEDAVKGGPSEQGPVATEDRANEAVSGDIEKGKEEEEEEEDEEEEEEGIADKICNVLSMPFIFLYNITMPDCKYEEPSDEDAEKDIKKLTKKLKSADAAEAKEVQEEIDTLEKQIRLRGEIDEADEAEDDAKVSELRKELYASYEPLTCGQKWYLFTFFVSLLWITILSFFMVTFMEKIGCAWGISSFIMGITFLAMGTSVPDALGSIAVAKEGEGDMAVSNAIGSNVFDICMGLGLPWVIATAIDGEGRTIKASTENICASIGILVGIVVTLYAALLYQKDKETGKRFVLTRTVGYVLFAAYVAFLVFEFVWVGAGLPE